MTELVTDGLCYWARQAPARPAIVFDGTDLVDYQSLDRWTDAAARCHAEAGLRTGDRIGIIGDNSLEWVVAALGALKLGAVVVPFNNRFTPDELRYLVDDSAPAMVLADDANRDRMAAALARPPATGDAVALRPLGTFTGLRHEQAAPVPRPAAGPDDVTQIVYTSGTSSRPKGVLLRQAYGMTELGGISSLNPAEQAVNRPESVGRGTVFTRHRVVRPDGSDCDPEEPGEIIVSGPGVTPGYWRNEAAYAEAMRDSWFHSGDVGVKDADGFIRMVDRLKDIIITGGYNVAPSEIEVVIGELPAVIEVCVVSAADAKFGEAPAAVIYARDAITAEEVTAHCRARR